MLELFKRMWVGWNGVARGIIAAQNTVLMGVVWVVAIGPVALWMRLAGRALLDHAPAQPGAPSHWLTRDPSPMDMERANRQF